MLFIHLIACCWTLFLAKLLIDLTMSSTKSGSASGTNAIPSQSEIPPSSTAVTSAANVVAIPVNQVFFADFFILQVFFLSFFAGQFIEVDCDFSSRNGQVHYLCPLLSSFYPLVSSWEWTSVVQICIMAYVLCMPFELNVWIIFQSSSSLRGVVVIHFHVKKKAVHRNG